jgi:hypothetical protein
MIRSRVYPSYIWQLPVTAKYHCKGGVDLYGYPKFVADIDISEHEDRVDCILSISGNMIIHMTGKVLSTKRGEQMRFLTYSTDEEKVLSANALVNPLQYGESRRRNDLVLEIGENHDICDTLKGISLSKTPLLYQYSPRGESILFPGRNVIDE